MVETGDEPRDVFATVGTGGSFGSSSLRQEIGLGNATTIERVEILWAGSRLEQVVTDLELDRAYRVVEGRAPEILELASRRSLEHSKDDATEARGVEPSSAGARSNRPQ